MVIRRVLRLLGDQPIKDEEPEASHIASMWRELFQTEIDLSAHTGNSLLALIATLPPAVQERILSFQLNDGLEQLKTLNASNQPAKRLQYVLAFGMATLVAAVVFTLCDAIYHGKPLPPWEIIALLVGPATLVVWQFQGVLSGENKELLRAVVGNTPPASVASRLMDRIVPSASPPPPFQPPPPPYGNQ